MSSRQEVVCAAFITTHGIKRTSERTLTIHAHESSRVDEAFVVSSKDGADFPLLTVPDPLTSCSIPRSRIDLILSRYDDGLYLCAPSEVWKS